MKLPLILSVLFVTCGCFAQESSPAPEPNIMVKWAPTGLILGSASLQAEYNFGGRNSLTAKVGLPVTAKHRFTYEDEKAQFNMKATSFLAGYRTYFSRSKHVRGLYYEPFFKYVYHASEGIANATIGSRNAVFDLMNTYTAFGVGVQLGAQFFIGKKFVIDFFFLGPEINSASNSFKAVEIGNRQPWTRIEARKVEGDSRQFLDRFPYIGKKIKVVADKENKQLNADYKGALPGIRTGVSIGFGF